MASCDDLSEVDGALAAGFRVAVVLPWNHEGRFTTPNGAKGIVCPAMAAESKGRKVTCNDCRLCDGSKPGPVIGFPNHGPQASHKRRAAKNLKEWHDLYLDSLDI
jgi:cytochrome c5